MNESELIDAYDKSKNIIANYVITRNALRPPGIFCAVADILVQHIDGTFLIVQRSFSKKYGGQWEASVGGGVKHNETPEECARRELLEETGILAQEVNLVGSETDEMKQIHYFEYLYVYDQCKDNITLSRTEAIDYKWVSSNEIKHFYKRGLLTDRMHNYWTKNNVFFDK